MISRPGLLRPATVAAAALAMLVSGCSDDGVSSSSGAGTDSDVSVETCDLLRPLFDPVDGEDESITAEEEASNYARFAETAPDEVAAEAQVLSDGAAALMAEGTPEEVADLDAVADEWTAAADALIIWAGPTCAGDDLIWACASPSGFLQVGPERSGTPPEIDVDELLGDDAVGRVRVDHVHAGVLYAATDESGLATDVIQVIPSEDGWARGNPYGCD